LVHIAGELDQTDIIGNHNPIDPVIRFDRKQVKSPKRCVYRSKFPRNNQNRWRFADLSSRSRV